MVRRAAHGRLRGRGHRASRSRLPGRRGTTGGRRDAGLERGLLPLSLLCLDLADGAVPAARLAERVDPAADWGPYRPWAEPFALLRAGRRGEALAALRVLPEPPPDLLYEALCCLQGVLAVELGDRDVLKAVHARLLPAAGQLAGAGSGLTAGPVDRHLGAVAAALAR